MKIELGNNITVILRDIHISFDSDWNYQTLNLSRTFADEFIIIRGQKFRIITPSELVRSRDKKDGYYRTIYIQLNFDTGEYYIGKSNRPTWSTLKRYQGSGLKFKQKFKKHSSDFTRYFIAVCNTQEETEKLEASIVTSELLSDEKCLNLVAGGGGTTNHPTIAETREKKRQYMKAHPAQFKPMLAAARKLFSSDTADLHARNERIKTTMSNNKYREMSRLRILKWKQEHPEEYKAARIKNKESTQTIESKNKRRNSFLKWRQEHPQEYRLWEEKRKKACTSKEAREKRKASLKSWNKTNPEQALENAKRRAALSKIKTSKAVLMINLKTGEVIETFPSVHDAGKWLISQNIAKSINCITSISAVCRKRFIPGHGIRKQAYGYSWSFKE